MGKSIKLILILVIIAAAGFVFWQSTRSGGQSADSVIEVTDSSGTVVKIPARPKRVVFLNVSNMDLYYAAGGTAVGKPTSTSIEGELAEKTADIPEVGVIHTPNIEKILELKPDLVVGVNYPAHAAARETLAKAGIPLLINKLDTFDDALSTLELYGKLTGHEDTAKEVYDRIKKSHDDVVAKTEGKVPPRSLVIFGAPGSFNMATKDAFAGNLVEQLGGGNIADNDNTIEGSFVPLSMEYVVQQDPEVILFISMSKNPAIADSFKKQMQENSLWNGVSAVKNGRIYYLSGALFTVNPGTRIAEALDILYKDLYEPEAVK